MTNRRTINDVIVPAYNPGTGGNPVGAPPAGFQNELNTFILSGNKTLLEKGSAAELRA